MKNKKLLTASIIALLAIPSAVPTANYVEASIVDTSTTQEEVFKDIPNEYPFSEIINEMHKLGYISGYPDGTFKPEKVVSRKHVAALLAQVLPLEPVRKTKEFKDVPKKHYYHDIIQKVQRAGIMGGDEKGNFNPEDSLTRAQIAKILDLAFMLTVKSNKQFHDVPSTNWGNKHIMAVYSNGIITGKAGYFKPNEKVTRADYAVFLHRALNPGKEEQLAQKIQGQFTDISDDTLKTSFDEGVNMMLSMVGQKITDGDPNRLITDGEVEAATMLGTRRKAQMASENILYLKRFVEKDSEFEKILDRWLDGDFSKIKNDFFTLLAHDPENMAGENWDNPFRINIRTKKAEEYYVLKIYGAEALKRHKEQFR